MQDLIKALADTSIPTILTVSGIALLFLALAGRFGGYIEIQKNRQSMAALTGAALLVGGVGLSIAPLPGSGAQPGSASASAAASTRGAGETRWILAGSFALRSGAEARQSALEEAGINALIGQSTQYDFLCPGVHVVLIVAPTADAAQTLLPRVHQVEPRAYLRNPATFDPSGC